MKTKHIFDFGYFRKLIDMQIKYSLSCLQCPQMYAQMDEKTGEAIQISNPIPLPALNVRNALDSKLYCE